MLTAEIWDLTSQPPVTAALGNSLAQPAGLLWNPFHPGQTMLCPPRLRGVSGVQMGVGSSVFVSDPDFCNLQIATVFSILQSGTLLCLKR